MDLPNSIPLRNYLEFGSKFSKEYKHSIAIKSIRPVYHKKLNSKCFQIKIPQGSDQNVFRQITEKKRRKNNVNNQVPFVTSHGIKSLEKKNIKKNDIYLFNCEYFGDELKEKLYKLYDKLTEANFNVKLIKNFEKLKALNTKKLIRDSSVFLSIVDKFTFNLDGFQSEICFAYESAKRIALILLDEVNTQGLDEKLKEIVNDSDIYPFYKDQKALDNIIPIQFNSFLFQINNHVQVKQSFRLITFCF